MVHNSGHKACELVAQILGKSIANTKFVTRIAKLFNNGAIPRKYLDRVSVALGKMPEAEQKKAIELMEKIARKMRTPGKAVQDHHWIGKSLQKEYNAYLSKMGIDLEKDNLMLLVIGHTGKHKESFFNLGRAELDEIVQRFPDPKAMGIGKEKILEEIRKSGNKVREQVSANHSLMNNPDVEFILLE